MANKPAALRVTPEMVDQFRQLRRDGLTLERISIKFGLSRNTVFRHLESSLPEDLQGRVAFPVCRLDPEVAAWLKAQAKGSSLEDIIVGLIKDAYFEENGNFKC